MDRLKWRNWSLKVKVSLVMIVLVAATAAAVTFIAIRREQSSFQREHQVQAAALLNVMSTAIADHLYFSDSAPIQEIVEGLGNEELLRFGQVYDRDGRIIADAFDPQATLSFNPDPLGQLLLSTDDVYFDWQENQLLAGQAVIIGNQPVGAVSVGLSTDALNANIAATRNQGIWALLVAVTVSGLLAFGFSWRMTGQLHKLVEATNRLAAGDLSQRTVISSQNELATLELAFNNMAQQLQNTVSGLEARTREIALAAELGKNLSQMRDLETLLQQAADSIRDTFGLYYTQIYLIDDVNKKLVLRAGTGLAGQQLRLQDHSLPLNAKSVNGQAAVSRQPVIVGDTEESTLFLRNSLLPETRSEMALPLIVGDKVIGVIDLQSNQPHALNEDNLPAFMTMAGQLTVAIQNADLLSEMKATTSFLDSVIEYLPLMLFVKNAENLRFVRLNQAGSELTGFPKEAFIGKNDYDFFPEEEADYYTAKDREVLAGGQLVDIPEEPIQTAHQGTRLLHTTKVPLLDAQGKPHYLLGISQDITEQKQMERNLAGRVKQLNLLNDIGRQANTIESIPEFLDWICQQVPQSMRHPEECITAITLGNSVYGDDRAIQLSRHIIEELQVQGTVSGRIYIAYMNEDLDFVDEESALIGGIGRRVSSYIETRQLVEQLQTQAAALRKVSEISMAVTTTQNPLQLIQRAAELAQQQFNLYQTAVFMLEENELALEAASGSITLDAISQVPRISLYAQKSIVAKAARNRQPIMVEDVQADPEYLAHPLLPGTRSEMAIPLLAGENVIGVLDIQSNKPESFREEELNIYMTLALQIATAWQNAHQFEQTQAALEELSSLQRIMTGESWKAYMTSQDRQVQGYLVNRHSVQPLPGPDITTNGNSFVTPVQVRGQAIGQLGVHGSEDAPITEETQALLTAISAQVAEALERARLFEETVIARAQTDQLFAGSERVVRSTTLDEILQSLVESTPLQQMRRVNFMFFDRPWGSEPPNIMTVSALWEKDQNEESSTAPVGTVYQISETPFLSLVNRQSPTIIRDMMTDERVDENTKSVMSHLGTRGMGVFPMIVGRDWIGVLTCQTPEPLKISDDALRQISSLVDQATTVAQTQRLFEESQARAQQEQILRQVSERVYGAVDAESVLRTAVKEVGRVLGLEAFVYLEDQTKN